MEDAIRARRERLRKGVYGHVPTAQEHVQALLQEQQGEASVMESITNQLLAEASSAPLFSQHLLKDSSLSVTEEQDERDAKDDKVEDDLYYKKIDWDLKREWNRQHKTLTKETQKAYKTLVKQRLNAE